MRKRRSVVFLFFLLTMAAALFLCTQTEKQVCMGVKILTEAQQEKLQEYVYEDLSPLLLYNGQKAAVDLGTSTVYIAQDIQADTGVDDLLGKLQINSHHLSLSFAPDAAFRNLAAAVADNHRFQLNVAYGSGKYMQYNLVFTTLPVLRIDGEVIGKNDKGKDICEGELCLWTPLDPDTGRYSVKTSHALWHVRGGWSATLEKTPFKVSLKDHSGGNRNLALAGLGADDDWILNPMNLDDTKLKEKLFCTLWNRRADQVAWNEPMSRGEYAEVIINQEYFGLFQLQRRVDGKFLNLGAEDVLLKSGSKLNASTLSEAYEIVHSHQTEAETYGLMCNFFSGKAGDLPDMDNFLDVNLFFQWASAKDNIQKNIFFLLNRESSGYRLRMLPWDTDMSWGTVWDEENGGFVYDFEASRQLVTLRQEYAWMKQYHPDLDQQLARRWFALRENLLTLENMTAILEQNQLILDSSGAQQRDTEQWGLFYAGEDSLENLCRSIESRLEWVDEYYNQYLQ